MNVMQAFDPSNTFALIINSMACSSDFPSTSAPSMMDALDNLRDMPNVRVIQSRVTQELIRGEIAEGNVHGKVRVVVSGPEGFNLAMKAMLHVAGVAEDSITILEA